MKGKIRGWICPNCFHVMRPRDIECLNCHKSINPRTEKKRDDALVRTAESTLSFINKEVTHED